MNNQQATEVSNIHGVVATVQTNLNDLRASVEHTESQVIRNLIGDKEQGVQALLDYVSISADRIVVADDTEYFITELTTLGEKLEERCEYFEDGTQAINDIVTNLTEYLDNM